MFFRTCKNLLLSTPNYKNVLTYNQKRFLRIEKKVVWKQRFSLAYAFLGMNIFIMLVYITYQGKFDWVEYYGFRTEEEKAVPKGKQIAKTLGIKNAKVLQIKGFTLVGEYDIENQTDDDVSKDKEDNA